MTTDDDIDDERTLIGSILSEETQIQPSGSVNAKFFNYRNECSQNSLDNFNFNAYTPIQSISKRSSLKSQPKCRTSGKVESNTQSFTYWPSNNENINFDKNKFLSQCTEASDFYRFENYEVPKLTLKTHLGRKVISQGQIIIDSLQSSEQENLNLGHHQNKSRMMHSQETIYSTSVNQWGEQFDEISDDIQINNDLDQLCGNQLISRKIQKIFENGRPDQKELIFNKIERSCLQYSKDIFGNYIIQRVLEKGTESQRIRLFNKIRPQFYDLSKNNFGCRVVQKILECIQNEPDYQDIFLHQIRHQIKSLLYDTFGNYVILKSLDTINKEKLQFMLPFVEDSVSYMIQQTYGCRIIQKIMEVYEIGLISNIIKLTINKCHILCNSEYGNYIIQYVIKNGPFEEQQILFGLIKTNICSMSLNKYGSNTVEKYIEQASQEALRELTSLFLKPTQQGPFFLTLATHPYGNYVFRKYLILCDKEMLLPIVQMLKHAQPYVEKIKSSEFGNLKKIFQDKNYTLCQKKLCLNCEQKL